MNDTRTIKRLRNLVGLARRKRPAVGVTPADVVHREHNWRLLRYKPRSQGIAFRTPVVLVPSLINRHYILDLSPGRSFVEHLVGQGHEVYIIDWGTPEAEDRYRTFDDVCVGTIGRAVRLAARESERGHAHVLGYCLGGTLAAIYTAAFPDRVASLTLLAAPIAFKEGGILATWTRSPSFDVNALVEACGLVPWPLLQASFHMLRPTLILAKIVGLIDRAWDDCFLDAFFATETWGNDNVSLPGAFYRRYIQELYREDRLLRGAFFVAGEPAQLERITCPTRAITFEHDHIVPPQSAAPILDLVRSGDKDHLHLAGGHVGAVVSRRAAHGLWPAISSWWAARDAASSREGALTNRRRNHV